MTNEPPYYRIFLLTVWQERARNLPAQVTWRFRLEDPRTGEQQLFTDILALMVAVQKITRLQENAGKEEQGE